VTSTVHNGNAIAGAGIAGLAPHGSGLDALLAASTTNPSPGVDFKALVASSFAEATDTRVDASTGKLSSVATARTSGKTPVRNIGNSHADHLRETSATITPGPKVVLPIVPNTSPLSADTPITRETANPSILTPVVSPTLTNSSGLPNTGSISRASSLEFADHPVGTIATASADASPNHLFSTNLNSPASTAPAANTDSLLNTGVSSGSDGNESNQSTALSDAGDNASTSELTEQSSMPLAPQTTSLNGLDLAKKVISPAASSITPSFKLTSPNAQKEISSRDSKHLPQEFNSLPDAETSLGISEQKGSTPIEAIQPAQIGKHDASPSPSEKTKETSISPPAEDASVVGAPAFNLKSDFVTAGELIGNAVAIPAESQLIAASSSQNAAAADAPHSAPGSASVQPITPSSAKQKASIGAAFSQTLRLTSLGNSQKKEPGGRVEPSTKSKEGPAQSSDQPDASSSRAASTVEHPAAKQDSAQSQTATASIEKAAQISTTVGTSAKGVPAKADSVSSQLRQGNPIEVDTGEVAAPTPSIINTARLMQAMGQSELRIGLQSRELGSIDIHTSLAAHTFTAQIFVEHGEVARTLSSELPGLYSRLADQKVLAGPIQIHSDGFSTFAGFDQGKRQEPAAPYEPNLPMSGLAPDIKATPILEVVSPATERLDIRI